MQKESRMRGDPKMLTKTRAEENKGAYHRAAEGGDVGNRSPGAELLPALLNQAFWKKIHLTKLL